MAMWLRDKAAGVAEWICPELNPQAARATSMRVYFLAAAVALLAAFVIWEASADVAIPGRTVSNRANMGAW